jgi:hypothetical protein
MVCFACKMGNIFDSILTIFAVIPSHSSSNSSFRREIAMAAVFL